MIISQLKDGLGNQLFIYAFARRLQYEYNEKIMLDLSGFEKSERQFALNHFMLNDNVFIPNELQRVYHKYLYGIKNKIARYTAKSDFGTGIESFSHMIKYGLYYTKDTFKYYPFLKTNRRNKYVSGSFEASGYSKDIIDILIKEFKVITPPSSENEIMIKKIQQCNAVCVHIRRGDYVSEKWKSRLQVCTEEYYNNGMLHIAKKVDSPVFFVFSSSLEDINWIKKNYKFKFKVNYVELDNPDYEEFRLMYLCKHFIISNSSFSWWASTLSENNDKVIVAPSTWYRLEDTPADDIYLDSWDLLDV